VLFSPFFSLLLIVGDSSNSTERNSFNMDNGLALKSNGQRTKKRKKEKRNEIHLSARCCSSVFSSYLYTVLSSKVNEQ
jgi:hypothetical protein